MKYIIIAGAVILILAISILIGYNMPVKETNELTEKEKTYKAIRILVYIIIGLIITGILLKLLLIFGLLSLK